MDAKIAGRQVRLTHVEDSGMLANLANQPLVVGNY
jgi:hypothetical protein